ncbi:hypothetical protein C485_06580 [Natrinema altunense JCM 12890]|uniref:Uncharacterized protein n=1 Tax=Natrinema altunense (strain JCM 12890 / CGMCC 1.3731 / AJ2) TaxID=1227494 RepID=L9ZNR7_NATA2|nr:hypothetical protein C485_06580 [Natrinema altunense JCM 12890]
MQRLSALNVCRQVVLESELKMSSAKGRLEDTVEYGQRNIGDRRAVPVGSSWPPVEQSTDRATTYNSTHTYFPVVVVARP